MTSRSLRSSRPSASSPRPSIPSTIARSVFIAAIVEMKRVHVPSLTWNELHSPSRKFHSFTKNISAALGARWRDQPGEAHPFDLQLRRVPPGAAICPYHSHTTQWEMFVVVSGAGTVRVNGARHPIVAGDVFIHPPGTAH